MRPTLILNFAAAPTSSTVLRNSLADSQRIRTPRGNWIDSLRVYCRGGHGGNGYKPKGGVGGKGGDVVFRVQPEKESKRPKTAVPNLNALFKTAFKGDSKKQRVTGGDGGHSAQHFIMGEPGTDKVLDVPPGVILQTDEGKIIAELNEEGASVTVAKGGEGGGPNNAWIGSKGSASHVRLDLRLIADVGLVGFPNAGKSTLLKAISRAKPKIANYPFTTIRPNLGHLLFPDDREIVMADLPGLIEGAHYNVGMGHKFLKHVERTKMIMFVIDVQGFQLNPNSPRRTPFETITLLNRELELYRSELVEKPALCLINKMDTDGAEEKLDELTEFLGNKYEEAVCELDEELRPKRRIVFDEVIPMSAKFSRPSVISVKDKIRDWLDRHHDLEHFDLRQRPQIGGELARLNVDSGPRLV